MSGFFDYTMYYRTVELVDYVLPLDSKGGTVRQEEFRQDSVSAGVTPRAFVSTSVPSNWYPACPRIPLLMSQDSVAPTPRGSHIHIDD